MKPHLQRLVPAGGAPGSRGPDGTRQAEPPSRRRESFLFPVSLLYRVEGERSLPRFRHVRPRQSSRAVGVQVARSRSERECFRVGSGTSSAAELGRKPASGSAPARQSLQTGRSRAPPCLRPLPEPLGQQTCEPGLGRRGGQGGDGAGAGAHVAPSGTRRVPAGLSRTRTS